MAVDQTPLARRDVVLRRAEFPVPQAVYPDLPEDANFDFAQLLLQPEKSFDQVEEDFWNAPTTRSCRFSSHNREVSRRTAERATVFDNH